MVPARPLLSLPSRSTSTSSRLVLHHDQAAPSAHALPPTISIARTPAASGPARPHVMVPKLVAPGASSDASSTGNEIPRPRLPPTCVPRAPLHPSLPSSSSAVPCRARPKLDPAAAAQHLRPTSPLAVPASSCWSRRAAPSADEVSLRSSPVASPARRRPGLT
ncbi:wiskott-Aldrich syndrome protein homolog 1-like isoform X2 [Hordeum vulgare subsp. vulgare]|uniref:wiskott-Aldrich syndrome protein homolog 1-like isoform X2 n=1 Tax=Hordeum vulgare subsp. vulgare TaxID=112509 RepID=UPI001D1A5591|nr:wiskott-Aldrich syndrome protein homolog 1-like isoform X2 [Hordeum vulgare subsp. vulgare]XP_044972956.1 wiskott-Aldrich syndrome protein homolog 1-like isoform X2 [Hordeum vulgare subsp. vulgare]